MYGYGYVNLGMVRKFPGGVCGRIYERSDPVLRFDRAPHRVLETQPEGDDRAFDDSTGFLRRSLACAFDRRSGGGIWECIGIVAVARLQSSDADESHLGTYQSGTGAHRQVVVIRAVADGLRPRCRPFHFQIC